MNQPRPRGRAGFRTSAFSALAIAAVFVACSEVGTGPEAPPLESAFLATSAQLGTPRLRVFEVCSTFPQGAAQDITVQVDVIQEVNTSTPTVIPTFFVTIPAETCIDVWTSGFPADEITVEQISPDVCEIGFFNSLITGNVLINRPFRANDSDFTGRIGNDVGRSVTFVNDCFGEIGDFVWDDLNQDGLQDPGEPGIPGVTVNLKDGSGSVIATTTTGSNGEYLFADLVVDATYTVEVDASTLPASFVPSPSNVGGDPTIDSNGSPTSTTLDVSNLSDPTLDFGYYRLSGEIGDFVWNDLDQDGVQDPGEPGIPGVNVNLKDAGGNVIGTTVTGPNGGYIFSGVTPGDYVVEIDPTTLPPNFVPTPSNQGGDPALDSNGSPAPVTLDPNKLSDLTIDFGYFELTGEIGDFIWNDLDQDGIQDPGEPGIQGIMVNLRNSAGALIATTNTGPSGDYLFSGLTLDETYTVEVASATVPANFVPSPSDVGPDRTVDSNGSPASTTLTAATPSDRTIDFGYYEQAGAIGDFVWNDLNQDGIQDPSEPGIPGVDVTLKDAGGNVIATTTTGPNGMYMFGPLPLGTYTVEIDPASLPGNFTPSPSNVGPDRTVDSNGSPTSTTLDLANPSDLSLDFGFYEETGEIGDFVWNDTDRDGIQDPGEVGIPDVTVNLKDAGGNVVATTTTGPNGDYLFSDLAFGDYTVEVDASTLPANYRASPSNAGSNRAVDSNGSPASVTIDASNQSDRTIDFGYYEVKGVIGDYVWNDVNMNGLQLEGEPGIGNVTVNLRDAGGNIVKTTVTRADGKYIFRGLTLDMTYTVEIDASTLPPNFVPSPNMAGSDTRWDSNGSPATVTLTLAKRVDTTIDFGYFEEQLGEIGDFVWNDLDRDGIQDPGEPGIPGIGVSLKDAGGAVVATTTTGGNGGYLFSGLTLGDYTVEIDATTLPFGYLPTTSMASGSTPANDSNGSPASTTLDVANPVDLTLDFGFFDPGPCDVCKGGVNSITLRYLGNPGDNIVFDIGSNETATQVGPLTWRLDGDNGDKLGDFDIFVNGGVNTNIHTSCSQPVDPGLVYGAFIIEDASSKDNGRVCPLGDCSFTQQTPNYGSDKFEWEIENTGTTALVIQSVELGWPTAAGALDRVKLDGDIHTDDVPAPPAGSTITLGLNDWIGTVKNRNVKPGDQKRFTLEFANQADLTSGLIVRITFFGSNNGTCFLDLGDLPDPPGGELCTDGKPQALTIQFTGDDCSVMNNTQDPSKAICTGDRAGADPVWVIAGDKDNATDPDAGRWFSGQVSVGGSFDIDAANDGATKLSSATHVFVFDQAMQTLLQSIEFHTSCSQPLFIGDQFGPILLTDWTPEP